MERYFKIIHNGVRQPDEASSGRTAEEMQHRLTLEGGKLIRVIERRIKRSKRKEARRGY